MWQRQSKATYNRSHDCYTYTKQPRFSSAIIQSVLFVIWVQRKSSFSRLGKSPKLFGRLARGLERRSRSVSDSHSPISSGKTNILLSLRINLRKRFNLPIVSGRQVNRLCMLYSSRKCSSAPMLLGKLVNWLLYKRSSTNPFISPMQNGNSVNWLCVTPRYRNYVS